MVTLRHDPSRHPVIRDLHWRDPTTVVLDAHELTPSERRPRSPLASCSLDLSRNLGGSREVNEFLRPLPTTCGVFVLV